MNYLEELKYKMEMSERLEALANEGECRCPDQTHIWHTNCWRGDDCDTPHKSPPGRCEGCGGKIKGLEIVYVENWRGADLPDIRHLKKRG